MVPEMFTSENWEQELTTMYDEWRHAVPDHDRCSEWPATFAAMEAEERDLRAQGQWRSGGRTLMRALWLHHDEVVLCRGLTWLLTPDGWHGLGASVLNGLLVHFGQSREGSHRAVIVTEESREGTRADIVARFPGTCLLIEAKVWAVEQATQADRLAELWADETPILVFLTRDGRRPTTAVRSEDVWRTLSWTDVARVLKVAIERHTECAPGAREYLHTLETYGGTP